MMSLGSRLAMASTSGRRPPHRDDHRHRHATLAGRAVGGTDGGVRSQVDVASGAQHVVLGPAERLNAFAVGLPRL